MLIFDKLYDLNTFNLYLNSATRIYLKVNLKILNVMIRF